MSRTERLRMVVMTVMITGFLAALSGTAAAQPAEAPVPSNPFIVNIETFAENVDEADDGTLLVTGGEGLYQVDPNTGAKKTLYQALSLGAVVVEGTTAYFAVGNDFAASVGSTLTGSIRAINLTTGEVTVVASNIPAPNGLVRMPSGELLYSTVLGEYEGIHRVGDDPGTLYAHVRSPNGLAVGPDGALYVGSTLGWQVLRINPVTYQVEFIGKFVVFCDDLTVTASGIFAASILGIWTPGSLLPAITFDLVGVTSIKAGRSSLFVTKMNGDILRFPLPL